jgi:hypothetical protein
LTILDGSSALDVPDVPYFAQWESADLVPSILAGEVHAREDPLWARSGAASPEEYEFWSWKACGVACLRMMLKWWTEDTPAALPLVRECCDAGAYVVSSESVKGLIYAPFCGYLRDRWNLDARIVTGIALPEVSGLISAGQFAILSVHPSVRDAVQQPPERGGHLVLAVGGGPNRLILHNPSGLPNRSQQFASYDFDTLSRYFAGRGMIIGFS